MARPPGEVYGIAFGIGGLVGSLEGDIIASYAMGDVIGVHDGVGGLVGTLASSATLSDSYATGSVGADSEGLGGLVGSNDGEINASFLG